VTRTRWQASVLLLFALAVYSRNASTQDPPCGDQKQCCFLPIVTTTDQGQEWRPLENTLPGDWVRGIAINPAPPHELLVAFRNEGISKSVDGGQSWYRVYEGSTRQVAFASTDPNVVYATVLNGVLRSDDRGETWHDVWPRTFTFGGWALAVDTADAAHVLVGINADAPYHVYETQDGGGSWVPSNLSLEPLEGIISLAIDPANPLRYFAGANTDVADHPQITRLYLSSDGGDHWALVENDLPDSKRLTSINFNPCNPNQILISRQKHGTTDRYLRLSDDSGETWHIVPLIDDDVGISPVPPCPIYADMHRSLDGGDTWQDITLNFADLIADDEAYFTSWAPDPWRNVLWIGTRYNGLFFLPGSVPQDGTGSQ
jgi:photosystem II stability/assembly factor-like uncharacterized protein